MKKEVQFIISIIFLIVSVLFCILGSVTILDIEKSMQENSIAGIALIAVVPMVLAFYGVQLICSIVSLGFAIAALSSYSKAIRVISIIICILLAICIATSIGVFVSLTNLDSSSALIVRTCF